MTIPIPLKRIGLYGTLSAVAYLIGQQFAPFATQVVASSVSLSPFVLRQEILALDSGGSLQITEDRTTACSTSGVEVRISRRPSQPERGISFLIIRPDGSASTSNSFLGAKMSGFLSRRRIEARRLRPLQKVSGCKTNLEKALGTQELLGITVAAVQRDDEGTRYTSWRALDFGCEEMKLTKESLESGKWTTILAVLPISFSGGEPSQELMDESRLKEIPELTPSQMRDLANQKLGLTPESCPKCFDADSMRKQDDAYRAHQMK